MPRLFGKRYTRDELLRKIGRIEQVAGLRLYELEDGSERGVRAVDFDTGSGFCFTVLVDRGLDIGAATWNGRALAWRAPVGEVGPAFYEPHRLGWLRTFHGGLLATCGLTQAGVPNMDGDEELGLHGRISHIPARQVNHGGRWEGDEYRFWVEGQMREVSIFGHDLCLTRRISAKLGEPRLTVEDRVENLGYAPAPHMILYHCNFGFPLLGPNSRLAAPSLKVEPRDDVAVQGVDQHATFEKPTPGYAEQCFFHHLTADEAGFVVVKLINPELGLAFQLRYRREELPEFTQWKQVGQGTYVVGLEPGNCRPEGRSAARQRGALVELAPGDQRDYCLEMTILDGEAIAA